MTLLKKLWAHRIARPAIGAALGAGAGFAYYAFIGCYSGG